MKDGATFMTDQQFNRQELECFTVNAARDILLFLDEHPDGGHFLLEKGITKHAAARLRGYGVVVIEVTLRDRFMPTSEEHVIETGFTQKSRRNALGGHLFGLGAVTGTCYFCESPVFERSPSKYVDGYLACDNEVCGGPAAGALAVREVTVNGFPVLVGKEATGKEVIHAAIESGVLHGYGDQWQLQGHNANGSNRVIGHADVPEFAYLRNQWHLLRWLESAYKTRYGITPEQADYCAGMVLTLEEVMRITQQITAGDVKGIAHGNSDDPCQSRCPCAECSRSPRQLLLKFAVDALAAQLAGDTVYIGWSY